jgi:hypothetical protein
MESQYAQGVASFQKLTIGIRFINLPEELSTVLGIPYSPDLFIGADGSC